MYDAFMRRDTSYEGIFFVGVKTTGIFCRPTCGARRPNRENIEFYPSAKDALLNGYRPCKVCNPLEPLGATPDYIRKIIDLVAANPSKKITDYELEKMNVEPNRVRRWFKSNHGLTFQGYQRMLRVNGALHKLKNGATVTEAAFENGYESLSGFSEAFRKIVGANPVEGKLVNVINIHRLTTPLGPMIAGATSEGICLLEFSDRRSFEFEIEDLRRLLKANLVYWENKHISRLEEQLNEFFDGKRKEFDIPLVTPGSRFQKSVWQQLISIPYGKTRSVRGSGDRDKQTESNQGCSKRERRQPNFDSHPLPPRHRKGREPHRLRRWTLAQEMAPRFREEDLGNHPQIINESAIANSIPPVSVGPFAPYHPCSIHRVI